MLVLVSDGLPSKESRGAFSGSTKPSATGPSIGPSMGAPTTVATTTGMSLRLSPIVATALAWTVVVRRRRLPRRASPA